MKPSSPQEAAAATTEDTPISPEQLNFPEAISKAMSKELAPFFSGRDKTRTRPMVYEGTKNGNVVGWLLLMRRFLERVRAKSTEADKAWGKIGHLEGEARNYIINKFEPERNVTKKVFTLLASRFRIGGNKMHINNLLYITCPAEEEDWMQYLDSLEGLRTQVFPDEPITIKRYEILQHFTDGVRDSILRQKLAVVYAAESYMTDPPTVASLRFTTRQLQRHRPSKTKPYDPRYAMRSRPHPNVPGQLVHPAPGIPQNVLHPPPVQQNMKPKIPQPNTRSAKQVPLQPMRAPSRYLFQLWPTWSLCTRMPI